MRGSSPQGLIMLEYGVHQHGAVWALNGPCVSPVIEAMGPVTYKLTKALEPPSHTTPQQNAGQAQLAAHTH